MKGDFTRVTFDPDKHYSGVLRQQGRVQLDADDNEATDIQLHFLRGLAADLIGEHGGPLTSFLIDNLKDPNGANVARDFKIQPGHYYVNGIRCENADLSYAYTHQPGFPFSEDLNKAGFYLAYLDVWERHITELEDADENRANIREVALRGPDTATRSKIIWQVKAKSITGAERTSLTKADFMAFQNIIQTRNDVSTTGKLRARAIKPTVADEPCLVSPKARYRGPENQLYRVEIHRSGQAWGRQFDPTTKQPIETGGTATFKWSRENGSVIFGIKDIAGQIVTLENLGRDARFGLQADDWVEIVNDDYVLQNRAEALAQIDYIDKDNLTVRLKTIPFPVDTDPAKHPILRRWDQRRGWMDPNDHALLVFEGNLDQDADWIELEDGVQIQFPKPDQTASYKTGDYWLIPARVATGDVEWPGPPGAPSAENAHGVKHYYAPLGVFNVQTNGTVDTFTDLRRRLSVLWV